LAPTSPYLAIAGVLERESAVRLRLILVDRRGRILRIPELLIDESFLGLEAELENLFKQLRKGTLRWTALNKGPIFPQLKEAPGSAPEVRFQALAETQGDVAEDMRNEDKDDDLVDEESARQEDKDRLRPVLRLDGAEKKKRSKVRSKRRVMRRKKAYKDFKDDDDK
jgi:hypothetical protein